jgi:hypothetical protein
MAAVLTIDRMHMAGGRGMFIRGTPGAVRRMIAETDPDFGDADAAALDRFLARATIRDMRLDVTACGLAGDPSDEVVDAWERAVCLAPLQQAIAPLERCVHVTRGAATGEYRIGDPLDPARTVDAATAAGEIAALMSDRGLKGTRLVFSFAVATAGWAEADVAGMCGALEVKTPDGRDLIRCVSGYGMRTFAYRPDTYGFEGGGSAALGGAHVALDCGGFVADWHTFSRVEIDLPIGSAAADRPISFRVVMLW